MMKHVFMTVSVAVTLFSAVAAKADSKAAFYDKPAAWLFDLIKQPTEIRNFDLGAGSGIIGATQIELNNNIECTIHGKTKAYPKSSKEAQLSLCTVRAAKVDSIFSQNGGGDVSFDGATAKLVFDLLPTTNYSIPRTDDFGGKGPVTGTQTMKSFGEAGVDGISCTNVDYVDAAKADVTNCSISWIK